MRKSKRPIRGANRKVGLRSGRRTITETILLGCCLLEIEDKFQPQGLTSPYQNKYYALVLIVLVLGPDLVVSVRW